MKTHYATGLVLVTWYLMLPPPAPYGRRLIYQPLSDWKLIDKFDSEQVCRQMLAELTKQMPDSGIDTARCVPNNDPYLTPEQEPKTLGYRDVD
jgi:hypothetical protein